MRTMLCLCAIAAPVIAQDTPIALPDLGQGTYKGAQGGLYPDGLNTPPPAHIQAALQKASQIVPRAGDGAPHPNGLIGFASIGMSNTCQEFGAFQHAQATGERNARIILVDTAQGGQSAEVIANPDAAYWDIVDEKIDAAGLTNDQVQVVWLKQAHAGPTDPFPEHALDLKEDLKSIAQILHDTFPNLKICFLSSRIYGGYSMGGLNPEPFAYESGFSVKWLIQQQIAGDPGLNYGQLGIEPQAPLLLWGPYIWANGTIPNGDGLVWLPIDFEDGGTNPHPSRLGENKVAQLLTSFFDTSPFAHAWWPPAPGSKLITIEPSDDAFISSQQPNTNFGGVPTLITEITGDGQRTALLKFDASLVNQPIANAQLVLRADADMSGGRAGVAHVPNDGWDESTVTWNASPGVGPAIGVLPNGSSRGSAVTLDVTGALSQPNGLISVALVPEQPGASAHDSKEGFDAPRLVITVAQPPCFADFNEDGVLNILDFVAFTNAFNAGMPKADCDQDQALTVLDFVCFQNRFTQGCF